MIELSSIEVTKLFGKYSYVLTSPESQKSLIILYGENGCGKTTLMKLVYHILSTADNRGHRRAIADTQFEKIVIKFSNQDEVGVYRENVTDGEDFKYEVIVGGIKKSCQFSMDKKKRSEQVWQEVLEHLKGIRVVPFFLGDNRVLESDALGSLSREAFIHSRRALRFESYEEVTSAL